ncbi:ABC transporter permease [Brevibacterium sp. 50QC2O2]|uniref:ABC transporter permease n=1 Tax=Brevibacterium sp. 50QC2O2 TaxID=2968459 RepID=UPI00211CAABD|nr:ABC transporter permease [Brevibacterium sp. 50QC2O2]MCQ9388147.1 ABC transporter permease [Brevibacterium sp. 50QC2O2]
MTAVTAAHRPGAARSRPRKKATHPWVNFIIRRLGGLVLSLVIMILVTFIIVPLLPGDPAVVVAGEGATQVEIDQVRVELGLEDPLIVQFWHYLVGVLTLNLGNSFASGQPVTTVVMTRLPFTAEIALIAIVFVLVIGIVVGLGTAVLTRGKRNNWLDHLFNLGTSLVYAVPNYVLATLLIYVIGIHFGWLPANGAESLSSMILPILAIMSGPTCVIARVVRREAATILEMDYVRTARGWRLPSLRVYRRYVVPNLLTTTLTLSGLILAGMLGGAVVIETVFAWPGLGKGVVDAIIARDYPVVRGIILLLGTLATLLILIVDVVLALIDPRNLTGGQND